MKRYKQQEKADTENEGMKRWENAQHDAKNMSFALK